MKGPRPDYPSICGAIFVACLLVVWSRPDRLHVERSIVIAAPAERVLAAAAPGGPAFSITPYADGTTRVTTAADVDMAFPAKAASFVVDVDGDVARELERALAALKTRTEAFGALTTN